MRVHDSLNRSTAVLFACILVRGATLDAPTGALWWIALRQEEADAKLQRNYAEALDKRPPVTLALRRAGTIQLRLSFWTAQVGVWGLSLATAEENAESRES